MKILHFLKTGAYSGAENVAITIISKLYEYYGYKGIYVSPDGKISDILENKGIEHAIISKNSVKEYQKVIDHYNPDVIHAHDFLTSVIAAFTKNNAKMISHLHNNPPWFRKINVKTIIYQLSLRRYQHVFGVSDSIFEEYVFSKKISAKGVVIGNPVDTSKVITLACEATENDESDVLFLGRLSTPKNPQRFIKIVKLLKKQKENINAYMVGDGEQKAESISLINELDLNDTIKMLGFKENPYGYLKNTKVLCVPSVWEGFGLVVAEAFSLGIPVVATPVGGMKDLVTDEVGFLSEDNEKMANEIIKLMVDNQYYAYKSANAKKRSNELNNIEEYIRNIYTYVRK